MNSIYYPALLLVTISKNNQSENRKDMINRMGMRVLHIVTYMGRGGLETTLMNYYRNIDRSEIQFDFLVHRSFEADYDHEIEALGGRIYRFSRLIPWSRKYRDRLSLFLKSHPEYQIVHVHQDCLSAPALMAAKNAGVPVRIAHSHSSNQDPGLKRLIKLYYQKKIPAVSTDLLACGCAAGDWMFRGSPYILMPNAIDLSRFQNALCSRQLVRDEIGVSDKIVIGHVGRFDPVKNQSFLLDILSILNKNSDQYALVLVGDGCLLENVKEKSELLGLTGSVHFLGVRSDIDRLMAAFDLFVFPSLYEGLPVSLVEAMASGLPLVLSDSIPQEGVLRDSAICWLSLEHQAKEWARRIMKIELTRKNYFKTLTENHMDIQEQAKWLLQFYRGRLEQAK